MITYLDSKVTMITYSDLKVMMISYIFTKSNERIPRLILRYFEDLSTAKCIDTAQHFLHNFLPFH